MNVLVSELLILKVQNSLLCLVGTWTRTVSIMEWQFALSLKGTIENKTSKCRPELNYLILINPKSNHKISN
jgi:hypothetical protein